MFVQLESKMASLYLMRGDKDSLHARSQSHKGERCVQQESPVQMNAPPRSSP